MVEIRYKVAEADDFDQLWPLVEESLAGEETKLTRDRFREDLFGKVQLDTELLAGYCEDAAIELNLDQARLSCPICFAITARVDGQLVGYLIFHRYYSTWQSRTAFINMIYVRPTHRGKKIATGLWMELNELCKREDLLYVFYETSRVDPALKDTMAKHGSVTFRDDKSDWSAYWMNLE